MGRFFSDFDARFEKKEGRKEDVAVLTKELEAYDGEKGVTKAGQGAVARCGESVEF